MTKENPVLARRKYALILECDEPVRIDKIEILQIGGLCFTQVRSAEGAEGLVPNAGVYQEHRVRKPVGDWYAPQFTVDEQGMIPVPDGPGWGITYDQGLLDKATGL